jgi:hypothetical protein
MINWVDLESYVYIAVTLLMMGLGFWLFRRLALLRLGAGKEGEKGD